mmetsp:Transcript_41471/g.109125  ORF Transcript_41471/g.109125 Transcript_41471/m.109125 type:complete len:250 (+) Transcript_41471:443-1192(+)
MLTHNFCCSAQSAGPGKDVLREFRVHPLVTTRRTRPAVVPKACPTASESLRQTQPRIQANHMHNTQAAGSSERRPPSLEFRPGDCLCLMTWPTRPETGSGTQEFPTTGAHFRPRTPQTSQSQDSPASSRRMHEIVDPAVVYSAAKGWRQRRLPISEVPLVGPPQIPYRQLARTPTGTSEQTGTAARAQRLAHQNHVPRCTSRPSYHHRSPSTLTAADGSATLSVAGAPAVSCADDSRGIPRPYCNRIQQ